MYKDEETEARGKECLGHPALYSYSYISIHAVII